MLSNWSYLLLALAAVPFESQATPQDQFAGYPRHHAIEGAVEEAVVPVAGRGILAQLLPRKSKKSLFRSSEAGRRKSNNENKNKHKQHQSHHNSTTTVDDEFTSTFSGASSTATRSHKQKHKQHQNHGHHNSTRTAEINTASSTATESSKHRHKQKHQHGHHHKTSLTSLSSTSTAEDSSSTADPTAEAIADMVRRQSIKASDVFCSRFTDSCSDTCSSRSLSVTANNCGTASKIGTASGFTFQCQCGSKDYTVTALAGSVLDPTTSTAVRVVTTTSTGTSTSSLVKTVIGTTTTTTLSTTTSIAPSPQRTTVTVSTNSSPPTVKKSSTTTLAVPTTTIRVTSIVPVMTVTETCEDEDESTSTGDQSTSTATTDQTSTAGDEQATTSTASASNQGSTAAANNVCAALNKRSMPNRRSQLQARAAPTFCQLYAASCAVSCASNGGVKTQTCTVASKNSYGLLCTCKDGTSDTQHALASIQGQASTVTSTTTSTKPATIITRRTSTLSATSTSIKKTTIRTTLVSSTSTTFKTVVLPATSTVTSLTVKTVTPASTAKTSTTLTTFLSTRTVTVTAGSTATAAKEVEVGSVGQLQIIDASSSEVYGLLSATLDDDAYAYTLDPTSEDGMAVTVIQSSVTAQAGLLGLQMSANQGTAPYLYLGLETQQLSDSGVQPSASEFLLFTDVAAKSTTLIPTKTNSDSSSYLAQPWLFTITDPSTGILSSTWTNPSGTTKSVVMQHFLICDSTTVDSNCFLTAASSSSTFDDFETDGYSISNVNLRFVVS